jgi:hypothetical protein
MYSDSIMYIPTKYSRHFSWDVIIGIRAWLDTICILHTSTNYFQSSHLLRLPHYPIQTFSCHLVYHFYNRFRFPSGKKIIQILMFPFFQNPLDTYARFQHLGAPSSCVSWRIPYYSNYATYYFWILRTTCWCCTTYSCGVDCCSTNIRF